MRTSKAFSCHILIGWQSGTFLCLKRCISVSPTTFSLGSLEFVRHPIGCQKCYAAEGGPIGSNYHWCEHHLLPQLPPLIQPGSHWTWKRRDAERLWIYIKYINKIFNHLSGPHSRHSLPVLSCPVPVLFIVTAKTPLPYCRPVLSPPLCCSLRYSCVSSLSRSDTKTLCCH